MVQPYPDPPWDMHGFAVFCPFVVRAETVAVPEGMTVVTRAGRAMGLFAYVRYEPPSPLSYREMIWMPAMVRHRAADGRSLRGYWVSRMWVDSEASLRGGREIWAIPKTLARFDERDGGVRMHADYGTEIDLTFRRLSPALPARSRMATLQVDGARIVRFEARTRARAALGHVSIARLSSSDPELASLDRATPVAGLATILTSFESTMRAPTAHERGTTRA